MSNDSKSEILRELNAATARVEELLEQNAGLEVVSVVANDTIERLTARVVELEQVDDEEGYKAKWLATQAENGRFRGYTAGLEFAIRQIHEQGDSDLANAKLTEAIAQAYRLLPKPARPQTWRSHELGSKTR